MGSHGFAPALVAQQLEHLTTDQRVGSSNLSRRAVELPPGAVFLLAHSFLDSQSFPTIRSRPSSFMSQQSQRSINRDLATADPAIAGLINQEQSRQETHLELIASENFASRAVMEAQGSVLTNKYAEGLPNKRYYGGCEHVDAIQELAIEGPSNCSVRPGRMFSPQWSPGQFRCFPGPSQARRPIMGLDLSHGGHLTHGSPVNVSGKWFNVIQYGVDRETQRLDMDAIRELAREHKQKLIVCGYSAYPRTIDFAAFRSIADEVGAYLLADMAHIAGLVAAGVHPSPVPHCDVVTTTTHKTLRGPRGGLILCRDAEFAKKFDKAVFPGTQGGPLEHVIAAKAVAFGEALQPTFRAYSQQVVANAEALAERLIERGIDVVSGGTDNHVVLLDLRCIGMTGKVADLLVSDVHITANKNTVPFDPEFPSSPADCGWVQPLSPPGALMRMPSATWPM